MPDTFPLLDLSLELQLRVFDFYFERPFNIELWQAKAYFREYGYKYRSLVKYDSRSKFYALWTSPEIHDVVYTAYLRSFGGHVELRDLLVDGSESSSCEVDLFDSAFRTLPVERVRVLRLKNGQSMVTPGQTWIKSCLERLAVREQNENPQHFACLNIRTPFVNLEKIQIANKYDLINFMNRNLASAARINGALDEKLMEVVLKKIWTYYPYHGDVVREEASGRLIPVEYIFYQQSLPSWVGKHTGHHETKRFPILRYEVNGSGPESIKVVSQRLSDTVWE